MTDRVDDFNRADNISSLTTPSDGGSAWVVNSGVWGVSSNTGYSASSVSQATVYLESGAPDVDVQVTLSAKGKDSGIIARATDDFNYLLFAAQTTTGFRIFERANSSFLALGNSFGAPLAGDVIRFNVSSSTLKVYLNGVLQQTTTRSFNSSATKHGLRANSDNIVRFDNFSISSLAAASTTFGGGLETLHVITDPSGGKIGALGGAPAVLTHITVSGGGSVAAGTSNAGYGQDTLQPVSITLSGLAGALAGVSQTLSPVTAPSGGDISLVGNALIGGAGDSLHALSSRSLGGLVTYALVPAGDAARLRALLSPSGGQIGVSDTQAVGGAPAWWGYEGQAGARGRPWWYSDLKDKAAALDRLRKARIELGILPAPQNKKIKKVIKETKEFIDEQPTPTTADYYMAREQVIRDKVEAELARLDEEDDEKAIMEMSKFFFPHKISGGLLERLRQRSLGPTRSAASWSH